MFASTRRTLIAAAAALSLGGLATVTHAAPQVGQPAPTFTALDSNGRNVSLAELKGKTVVLEWTNDGCPYVRKWYGSGEMQKLQKEAAQLGAVWLSVVSSAPGAQGYVDGPQANEKTKSRGAAPAHVLLDPKGTLGRAYGAETTPHMYVIAPDGKLAYAGGIDSIASTNAADIPKADPYAKKAIEAVVAGKPVATAVTRPYGCGVKYGS
ncbi:MAG: redoxin domain-containing protein [Aquabacterium sp.]|jgi:peroxiredoxin|nr:MAG: redoxin domain-containing protein [Aquabacterium sp.]